LTDRKGIQPVKRSCTGNPQSFLFGRPVSGSAKPGDSSGKKARPVNENLRAAAAILIVSRKN